MKVTKLNLISQYKSFHEFNWSDFCREKVTNADNTVGYRDSSLNQLAIFFGENGSGKSSICEILKEFSQRDIFNASGVAPSKIEIEFKDSSDANNKKLAKYEGGSWENQISKENLIIFDSDFINRNIHTHGARSNSRDEHAQNSGRLIIEIDETANNFREEIKNIRKTLEEYVESKKSILNKSYSDLQISFYEENKNKTKNEIDSSQEKQADSLTALATQISGIKYIIHNTSQIASIPMFTLLDLTTELFPEEALLEISERNFQKEAENEADESLKHHLSNHWHFIESGLNILKENPDACPFCKQDIKSQNTLIEKYKEFFNESFKRAKEKYLKDIEGLIDILDKIDLFIIELSSHIPKTSNSCELLASKYGLKEIYDTEMQIELASRVFDLSKLRFHLSFLKAPILVFKHLESEKTDPSDLKGIYANVKEEFENLKTLLADYNKELLRINTILAGFKSASGDTNKLNGDLNSLNEQYERSSFLAKFLVEDLISEMKEYFNSKEEVDTLRQVIKTKEQDLENHLVEKIPSTLIEAMLATLSRFNLKFELNHLKSSARAKEYAFSFDLTDKKGNKRDFKNGLSEGERQVISLAFFIALNSSRNTSNCILIFDDPITSLDAANLKVLSEVIQEQVEKYSQVIVFTHHALFHKYLKKIESPNPCKYVILKNKEEFGGSFVFCEAEFDLFEKLKNCGSDLKNLAESNQLNLDEFAIKYGQLLRLGTEKLVKNKLLMWEEESFDTILRKMKRDNLKLKLIDESDWDCIHNIHKYCNYSNYLHEGTQQVSALSELKSHIEKFITIIDKVV
jgi:wobble nucleotide-excising tRNase